MATKMYEVQSGDTLGVIAQENNTTVDKLMALNKQIKNKNHIYVGQDIQIPIVEEKNMSMKKEERKQTLNDIIKKSKDSKPEEVYNKSCRTIHVKKVTGPKEITIGESATYQITKYNIDDLTNAEKKKVKWKVEVYENYSDTKPIRSIDDCSKVSKVFKVDSENDKLIINDVPKIWCGSRIRIYPYFEVPIYTVMVKSFVFCKGYEMASFELENKIPSYSGEVKSPFVLALLPKEYSISIRKALKEAASYHGIPQSLLAVILQNENGQNSTWVQKTLQLGERRLTTIGAALDEVSDYLAPDKLSQGSTGLANMNRAALKNTIKYYKKYYNKKVVPSNSKLVQEISGLNYYADLYYAAAHLRQLIDCIMSKQNKKDLLNDCKYVKTSSEKMDNSCFSGVLTEEDFYAIVSAYNGFGDNAKAYADSAKKRIDSAIEGKEYLYFYEK